LAKRSVWIVDYDIPSEPAAVRKRFYRALTRILSELGVKRDWSTWSVVVLQDEEVARAVYETARRFGVSHLYRGEQLE
jgi:hypothetical protein